MSTTTILEKLKAGASLEDLKMQGLLSNAEKLISLGDVFIVENLNGMFACINADCPNILYGYDEYELKGKLTILSSIGNVSILLADNSVIDCVKIWTPHKHIIYHDEKEKMFVVLSEETGTEVHRFLDEGEKIVKAEGTFVNFESGQVYCCSRKRKFTCR